MAILQITVLSDGEQWIKDWSRLFSSYCMTEQGLCPLNKIREAHTSTRNCVFPSGQCTPPISPQWLRPCPSFPVFSVSITGQRLYTAAAPAKTRIFIFAGWKLIVDGNCSQYKVALAVAWAGQMSKFQELKRELSILEKTFGSDHEHLRVEANGLDEVTYRFLAPNGEHVVHCNIYVSRSFIFCTC